MKPILKSYFHRGGAEPLLGATISEHFSNVAERYANRDALVSLPQHRRLTYMQLACAIDELARGLVGLGFRKGDRIGIWPDYLFSSLWVSPLMITTSLQALSGAPTIFTPLRHGD